MQDLNVEFGRLVRKRRKTPDVGLNQEELGGRVGLSRTAITNIEQGRQQVTLRQVYLLASALGCQPADLLPDLEVTLEIETSSVAPEFPDDPEAKAFAARILSRTNRVSPSEGGS